jgi:tRNA(Arg) A34 adenosine deaminase TadA
MILPLYFNVAKEVSRTSDHVDFKVGAAIYVQGKLISKACNNTKSHPAMIRFDRYVTTHAEASAINKVKNKSLLNGSTMIVYREKKLGGLGLSRCCELCMELVKLYKIKKIIYTTDTGYMEERIA